jgi:CBS domain-containing protein
MTAADIMTTDVTVVSPEMPIDDLVELFSLKRISGAPVVDGAGKLIGVVSETDVAQALSHPLPNRRWSEFARDLWLEDLLGDLKFIDVRKRVRDLMNDLTFDVEEGTPVQKVVETLLNLRVHRVIVVDQERRVKGVISSFDLVRLIPDLLAERPAVDSK